VSAELLLAFSTTYRAFFTCGLLCIRILVDSRQYCKIANFDMSLVVIELPELTTTMLMNTMIVEWKSVELMDT
jgi:hypothetical protein